MNRTIGPLVLTHQSQMLIGELIGYPWSHRLAQGFPLEFYFRGHKSPLTLIQGDISGDFRGQSYDT